MKKIFTISMVMGVLIFLAILWVVLYGCQEAKAGTWVKTGATFDIGLYQICDVFGSFPSYCVLINYNGTVEEVDDIVRLYNKEPQAVPGISKWFRWDDGYWIKYKPPFKFIEGEIM